MPPKKKKKDIAKGLLDAKFRAGNGRKASEAGRRRYNNRITKESRIEEEKCRKEHEAEEEKRRILLEEFISQVRFLISYSQQLNRLATEIDEILLIESAHSENVNTSLKEIQDIKDWANYVACGSLPNPKIESDVNTYLALWEEEHVAIKEEPSLECINSEIAMVGTLLEQLETERSLATDICNTKRVNIVHQQILKLLKILFVKWDITTQKILQHMDYFSREPSENFQIQANFPNYSFGLWGNLTKNPRHKIIDFAECKMQCSLPKPLVLSNVAIRMLYSSGPNSVIPYEEQRGQKMAIIGGVLDFDLIDLPDLPKIVEPWIIRTSK